MYYNDRAMKERIKNKLKDPKKISQSKEPRIENDETTTEDKNENEEIEEYYLGKDRIEERKKKAYVTLLYILRYVQNRFIFLEKNLQIFMFNSQRSNKEGNTRVKAQRTK